jgi:1-acyl-sn-glycerol-3-phosphate acyltransferase
MVRKQPVIKAFRTLATTLSLYLVTHLFVFTVLPIAILIVLLDRDRMPAIKRWFVKGLFAIVGKRLKVSGRGNIEPGRRYVIASNYPSGYAGFALIGEFPQASLVAHASLRTMPILRQALQIIGVVFVRPGLAGRGRNAIDLYLAGSDVIPSIIILPEGSITRDGKIHRFRRGFVHIQRQTGFDVLPVTLNGLYKLKPFGRLYADPDAEPEMVIHPAVRASVASQLSNNELIGVVRDTVASAYRP